jgi:hypothetical protein
MKKIRQILLDRDVVQPRLEVPIEMLVPRTVRQEKHRVSLRVSRAFVFKLENKRSFFFIKKLGDPKKFNFFHHHTVCQVFILKVVGRSSPLRG